MKNSRILPLSGLIGCVGALALRLGQNHTGFEAQTGLAVPGNLFAVALPVFLLLCAGAYAVLSRTLPVRQEAPSFRVAFPAGNRALLLPVAAGAALWMISGIIELADAFAPPVSADGLVAYYDPIAARLGIVSGILTVACAVCLFLRISVSSRGSRADANGTLLLIPIILLVLRIVLTYREVSVNPALDAYYVQILALAALALALYYTASFAYENARPRRFAFCTLIAAVLCAAPLTDPIPLATRSFYLGGCCWMLGLLLLYLRAAEQSKEG